MAIDYKQAAERLMDEQIDRFMKSRLTSKAFLNQPYEENQSARIIQYLMWAKEAEERPVGWINPLI